MVSILISLLILIVIFGAIFYVIRIIPIEEPFKTAAYVVILLIFILVLLGLIGIIPGWPIRPLA
jgi:heme A synthase